MIRPMTANVAIFGTAAILAFVSAGPAMAKGAKPQSITKEQHHVQRHITYRSGRSDAMPASGGMYRGPAAGANTPATSHSFDSYTNY